jgi:hypothetical protein
MALAHLTAGNAFVTLFVAGGLGMLTYIVIVVPLERIRSFAERGIRLMAR